MGECTNECEDIDGQSRGLVADSLLRLSLEMSRPSQSHRSEAEAFSSSNLRRAFQSSDRALARRSMQIAKKRPGCDRKACFSGASSADQQTDLTRARAAAS